ncbi:MAG: GNAT family N-acetyltransferase [Gammaproteobacteria bacterium]
MTRLSLELDTPRLKLREFLIDDAEFVLQLLNEPSFIEFIGDRGIRTIEDAKRYLQEGPIASYHKYGHGLLHVSLKERDVPIGMCGLVKRDTLPDPDIGFALLPSFWNKGYVTEAARAAMEHGQRALGMDVILGITSPGNARSIAVLRKLGLHFVEEKSLGDRPELLKIFRLSVESAP